MPTNEKILYLTFDDGPIPEVTEFVLGELKKYSAKATFFCIGENIDKHPEIFRKIAEGGHAAGNHTYHHLNGWKTNDLLYFESTERTRSLVSSRLFRPPYGKIKKSQIKFFGDRYKIIMWDVLTYDYHPKVSAEKCLSNVLRKSRSGSIVVFHDSVKAKQNLYYALPLVLKHFSELGYRFETIS